MSATLLWHLWPGRHWPASRDEEVAFVTGLTELGASSRPRRPRPERGDMIAVLNALRCGIALDDLLRAAPGLGHRRLLFAYQELDRLRLESLTAWSRIVARPSMDTVVSEAATASRLLPVPVKRIVTSASLAGGSALADTVGILVDEMNHVSMRVLEVERQLSLVVAPSEEGVALGRQLYDPYRSGLWASPYYRPERVGTLTPLRVTDLLGEKRR